MIVVTGAAGFIGSCLVGRLNQEGYKDIVIVDDFSRADKKKNLEEKIFSKEVHRDIFPGWLRENQQLVQFVFHLGARTDTTEFDKKIFDRLNLNFSKNVWLVCAEYGIPMVYASSAATYGGGELGYDDDHSLIERLHPLNPYGESKNEFDKWVLKQESQPGLWAGLKFFNVYGPNEYHKGRMASVVLHAFHQIKENGKVKLFRSHNSKYKDGEQLRDFIYVKDVAEVCLWFLRTRKHSGLYNLGSGKARTFWDLANSVIASSDKKAVIEFIDTPDDIRDKYQYFTEAKMEKLKSIGCDVKFHALEDGVRDYVENYLKQNKFY
ncbi:MAG: ADP-glyceromanno-heptose 6-epimerase [Bacteroidetes bacterium]|nr:ADP-glyceromanno-heptose 6-epimerase [Bacteroidota bacterium]